MEDDFKKVFLLRSYSRMTVTSTTSSIPDTCSSASGLERFLPRTSTPEPSSLLYVDNEDCFDPYGIFRTILESAPKRATVRGIEKVPYHFITGHLVRIEEGESSACASLSLDSSREKRITMKTRLSNFRRTLKGFFRRYYRSLIWNKCDYTVCPVTCECQKMKSFLNKTIVLDDEDALEG